LAEAIAYSLALPLFVVRYDAIIGSYLGETASRLRRVMDYARTTPCVLFFDEFDAIGKERGDIHETGEIKRVVTSLLMQIDDLPSYTVVVAATNHAELLDRAVWRRFQIRLNLPAPKSTDLVRFVDRFLASLDCSTQFTGKSLVAGTGLISYAEMTEFCTDVRRGLALRVPELSPDQVIEEELRLWVSRFAVAPRRTDGQKRARKTTASVARSNPRSEG
jgi:AAA+ superfamily predicted ATPase